jgi:hypothetical protein
MTEQLAAPLSRPPGSYTHLQALDDAIRYRMARLEGPCRKCRPGARCHDHACDLGLLAAYHRMAQTAVAEIERGRQARYAVVTRRAG